MVGKLDSSPPPSLSAEDELGLGLGLGLKLGLRLKLELELELVPLLIRELDPDEGELLSGEKGSLVCFADEEEVRDFLFFRRVPPTGTLRREPPAVQ